MRDNRRRKSKAGVFLGGMIVGILVSSVAAIGLIAYVIKHPQKIMVKAVDMGMDKVVEKTVQSMPKNYIGQRQEDIASSAQHLANAYSQNKITAAEMNLLARKMFAAIADQQLSQQEIDELLRIANSFSM